MANMEYCRFQNTYSDLRDCDEHMDDKLSPEEAKSKEKLIKLCKRIVECYGEDD